MMRPFAAGAAANDLTVKSLFRTDAGPVIICKRANGSLMLGMKAGGTCLASVCAVRQCATAS
jgi:hypothetical protein